MKTTVTQMSTRSDAATDFTRLPPQLQGLRVLQIVFRELPQTKMYQKLLERDRSKWKRKPKRGSTAARGALETCCLFGHQLSRLARAALPCLPALRLPALRQCCASVRQPAPRRCAENPCQAGALERCPWRTAPYRTCPYGLHQLHSAGRGRVTHRCAPPPAVLPARGEGGTHTQCPTVQILTRSSLLTMRVAGASFLGTTWSPRRCTLRAFHQQAAKGVSDDARVRDTYLNQLRSAEMSRCR